jgi:putative transposase
MRVRGPKLGQEDSELKKRFTAEQIIRKLREAEGKLASGQGVPQVCRELGISESSYYRWKTQYGGIDESEARRLRELERENARLKKIVAEQAIDISILREAARGNY